jgi:hypothetical protein
MNTAIKLNTVYGIVTLATVTAEVALAVFGTAAAMAARFAEDVKAVRDGLDIERLREQNCDGTDPDSIEETAWSDWTDAVSTVAEFTGMYPGPSNEVHACCAK